MKHLSEKLMEIEKSVSCLSQEEQLWLVEKIIQNMKLSNRQENYNKILNNLSYFTNESIEEQLINMANDLAIQVEIETINLEFANTEMDGLTE